MQSLFSISVYHIEGCNGLPLVHPHVQLCIEAGREAPFRFIKLVTADPKVGHDAVYSCDML